MEQDGDARPPVDDSTAKRPAEPHSNRGLVGIAFVLVLVGTAIWLMNRMQTYASLGDCAFTHAPQCRELIDK